MGHIYQVKIDGTFGGMVWVCTGLGVGEGGCRTIWVGAYMGNMM